MSSWILFLLAGLLVACGGKPSTPTITPTVGMIVWGGDHPSLQMDLIGNLYVVDKGNSQVLKFDRTGKILLQWGSQGTGDGQFDMSGNGTGFVAVDSQGYIYVTDTYHVQKFDNQGKFLTRWGTEGTGDGQFMLALMLAIDPQDNIYVVDLDNDNVQKFDSNGKFLLSWGG
jgi:DNA-binding beta-propeller fold protein YncE